MKKYTAAAALLLVGCVESSDDNIYTLYRGSPISNEMRVHMATFDSNEGGRSILTYNRDNCEIAADLFKSQPGVTVGYWCEKGPYRE